MNNRTWLAGVLALALFAPPTAIAATAELNTIRQMELTPTGLTIQGSSVPTFTVFKLDDPSRLVIDLAGSDISSIRGPKNGQGLMAGVTVTQVSDKDASVGRIVIALQNGVTHDVKAVGNNLVVTLKEPALDQKKSTEPVRAIPSGMKAVQTTEEGAVVAFRDESKTAANGQKIQTVVGKQKGDQFEIRIKADGSIGAYTVTELVNPPRLAIDLDGFRKGLKVQTLPDGSPVSKVRTGRHEDHVRLVLDGADVSAEKMPSYDIKRMGGDLLISLNAPQSIKADERTKSPAQLTAAEAPKVADAQEIRDISYKGDEKGGRVLISVGKGITHSYSQPDPRTAILTLTGATLPKQLAQNIDTSSFEGPVSMVSAFVAPGKTDTVQIVAMLDEAVSGSVRTDRSGILVWELDRTGDAHAEIASEAVVDGNAMSLASAEFPQIESAVTSSRASASQSSGRKPKYTGQRVSFEFKDIEIHNLLRIFADISKKNIIVGDNVGGKVTIKLRNVPWDQALDIVLKSKGLDKEESGSIIRIAPAKILDEERRQAAEKAKLQVQLEPLKVRIIPINYATASGMADRVKDVLSDRGKLSVDARTNVIIVKDVAEAIARAEGLVRRLDTQTPQVLIESRIVEASVNFSREFGIQWGGDISFGPSNGNATGLAFPNSVRIAGAAGNEGTNGLGTTAPNYAVNLPASIGMGQGGGLGFTFGSAGGTALLNLRLSAMENRGQSKTISAPRVITLDNNTATISQGVSIPYSQTSASGVNTTFVEAKLELQVTPHVTSDGSILLDITASNNQADAGMTGANGQPSISKKEAKTQVLVKDGDTTVIGGIYTRSQGSSESGVPLFSRIPVLGWLFKNNSQTDTRTELLIFITPRIINRNQSLSGTNDLASVK